MVIRSCNSASVNDGDDWTTEILRYCNEIAPNKFHTNGIDHSPWFNDFGFSRKQIATTGHVSIVYSYLSDSKDFKYSDPSLLHLAEYEIELAYAYHIDLNRRVWVEGIGL